MEEPWKCYAKGKKPDREGCIFYDYIYMKVNPDLWLLGLEGGKMGNDTIFFGEMKVFWN